MSFDSETIADVRAMYPTQVELDALIASGRERHQAALERAGVPRGEPDWISSVYFDFELDVGLERASAELMVPWQVLEDGIRTGEPALLPLLDGAPISRATFGQVFRGVLCSNSLGNNRPVTCQ